MKRLYLLLNCLFFFPSVLLAQSIQTSVSHQALRQGGEIVLNLAVEGAEWIEEVQFPNVIGLAKKAQSYFSEVKNGMGFYRQTYIAQRPGMMVIPSFAVDVGRKILRTKPHIVVVSARPDEAEERGYQPVDIDAEVEIRFSRESCLIGEGVPVEVVLSCQKADVDAIRIDESVTEYIRSQFLQKGVREFQRNGFAPLFSDARRSGFRLYEGVLFPQESGQIQWDSIAVTIMRKARMPVMRSASAVEPGRFFSHTVYTNSPALLVESVPEPAAIGPARLEFDLLEGAFTVGEQIPIDILAFNSGDPNRIPIPEVEVPSHCLLFGPEVSWAFAPNENGEIGFKRFSYWLVSAQAGEFPAIHVKLPVLRPQTMAVDTIEMVGPSITVKGEDLPQLLQGNQLERFYEKAIARGRIATHIQRPASLLGFASVLLSMLAVLAFWLAIRKRPDQQTKRKN
ncbi:MAG: BatD family protein [Bacteroidota bacterium]